MKIFKHFALVALLAMFLTGIGSVVGASEAKAMTLDDLEGNTYRITDSGDFSWIQWSVGSVVRFDQQNGDYVIKMVKPSARSYFRANDSLVTDMYVMDGYVHCSWVRTAADDPRDAKLEIYNGGQTLKVIQKDMPGNYWELRKV